MFQLFSFFFLIIFFKFMNRYFKKFYRLLLVLVTVHAYVFYNDPTSNGQLSIINSKIGQNIFDSFFFDSIYVTKSSNNTYAMARAYYEDNTLINKQTTIISSNFSFMSASRYPKSCAIIFDYTTSKGLFYGMQLSDNGSDPRAIIRDSSLTNFSAIDIQLSSDCYNARQNDQYYLDTGHTMGLVMPYTLNPIDGQSNYLSNNFEFIMDQYGFLGLPANIQMNLFSKNKIQCIADRCIAFSYEPVQPVPFKVIILLNQNSTWRLTFQFDDQSLIMPILNVNSNFKNIVLSYQKVNRPVSAINIQWRQQIIFGMISKKQYKLIYLSDDKNGKSRQITLSEKHLLYVNKTLDSRGFIRFTVYQIDQYKKIIDYLVDPTVFGVDKYKFSVIQEDSDKNFSKVLYVFQSNQIFYWCQEYSYNACINFIDLIDYGSFVYDVLNVKKLYQSTISTFSDTILIIIITIPTFAILFIIVWIILSKTYVVGCPDCCWTGGCAKVLAFLKIDQNYKQQEDDSESLQSYLDKLQMQKRNKQKFQQNQDQKKVIKQLVHNGSSNRIILQKITMRKKINY